MNKNQIKKYFDNLAPERDKWKKRNGYYNRDITNFLKFLIPEDSSVLEIGCSTGDILGFLNPKKGKGIDISPKMIEIARKKYPSLDFEEMDMESLSLKEKYDYIIISDVIGFLSDIQGAFFLLHQVCHQKSRLVITHYNQLWEPVLKLAEKLHLKAHEPWQSWISSADLENLLYLSGFETIKKGERLLFPKYIPFFSLLINRFFSKLPILKNFCLIYYVIVRPFPETSENPEPTVSVIAAAKNESGTIASLIERTPQMGSHTEIIFVEGHSKDDTLEKMREAKEKYKSRDIKILIQEGIGKGDAVRKAFDSAKGDILMILDADLGVPPEDLVHFYNAITRGKGEFINGCRLVYPIEKGAMGFLNLLGNKFFGMMFSWLLDQRVKDTLCGTKVLWRDDYEKIKKGRSYFGNFDPFGDFDLLFGASKLNLKIIDVPVRYKERVYGKTKISRFKHGWLLLKMCAFAVKKIKLI